MTSIRMGRMMRTSGTPAAFMESSSNCSPMLPNVMSEANKMASGSDMGISVIPMYQKNCPKISSDSPLPISSSM